MLFTLLLQMPLVAIRVGNPKQGHSFSIIMEKFSGTDYSKIGAIINGLANISTQKGVSLEKSVVKMLLSISQSDRERECLRYAIYKASGMIATMVRQTYGFENIQARSLSVELALLEVKQIREAIDDLATTKEKSVLVHLGFNVQLESADSSADDSNEAKEASNARELETPTVAGCGDKDEHNPHDLQALLSECNYNWFEFLDQYQCIYRFQEGTPVDEEMLYNIVSKFKLDTKEFQLVEQSFQAFAAAKTDMYDQNRIVRGL